MSSLAASYVLLEPTHPSLEQDYEPGSSGSYAHDWSKSSIKIEGRYFVDRYGRACNLRGVNLSGNCKAPKNHDNDSFPAHPETVTFVDRPFSLEEAPEHFARLRRWGLTFIRFLVTWEALAPASPTAFSTPYLTYLRSLLSLLPEYGITAFVSLHQDVWSRYSGGSGAPAWTLSTVGFSIDSLEECGAAWLKGMKGGGLTIEERGLWPTGYQKLAAATMATCFWAGDTFADKLKVKDPKGDGEVGIQTMLQNAFLDAWEVLVQTVGDLEGVIGFEMLNEPHPGYINLPSLYEFDYNTELHLGAIPSALTGFTLGAGHSATVPFWSRSYPMPSKLTHQVTINQEGKKVWREDGPTKGQCLWEMHGVWGWDNDKNQGIALKENYFKKHPETGNKVDWYTDFYFPFLKRWEERIRAVSGVKDKILFVEAIPNEFCPRSWTEEHQLKNMVYAPHWYDLNALFQKSYGNLTANVQAIARGLPIPFALYWGHASARNNFSLQIGNLAKESYISLGEKPVIIGECGIPMDMNEKEAFRSGNFKWQAKMMDAMITGLERSLLGFTLWNYNPDNVDDHGDSWNGENFSWFGMSHRRSARSFPKLSSLQSDPSGTAEFFAQQNTALDDGGRILRAVVRPYPAKVAGIPKKWTYESNTGQVDFTWEEPVTQEKSLRSRETEIFFPSMLLENGRKIVVDGLPSNAWTYDVGKQTLYVLPPVETGTKRITVRLDPPLEPFLRMATHWQDFAALYLAILSILAAIIWMWVL
ncbi:glycoside hydrolase family 5 protein [Sphaerobolus stellatus SS14]|uniref:Glycoside hydrolase family 5 protein n=1 Tax=Sphaerobolus stellatus (strain SS14) TaxID=990650 RepID=A0A0C9TV89_SPHS4|nr:glycoside hydrolase family 5 protein [Sphaerobolus stellatus SS14]